MLSLLVNKLESVNNSKVEIYLAISAIVYVILHYLIFNKLNNYTSKYKYIFYVIVIMDIIYAHKLYKSKLPTKEPINELDNNLTKQVNMDYPQMIIERPFIDNDVHNQQYTPFVGNINLIPQSQIDQIIKNQEGRNITIQQNKEQVNNAKVEIEDDEEINAKSIRDKDNNEIIKDVNNDIKDNINNNVSVSDVNNDLDNGVNKEINNEVNKESNNEVINDSKEEIKTNDKEDNKDAVSNNNNDKEIEDEEITLSPINMD